MLNMMLVFLDFLAIFYNCRDYLNLICFILTKVNINITF